MQHACWAAAAVLLAATLAYGLALDEQVLRVELGLRAVRLDPWRRAISVLLLLVPVAALAFGLVRLREAFRSFAAGDLFSFAAATGLRDFAGWAAASAILAQLVVPALCFALTIGLARGPQVVVRLGAGQLTILVVAGAVWVFAHILSEARLLLDENLLLSTERRALADENAQFV